MSDQAKPVKEGHGQRVEAEMPVILNTTICLTTTNLQTKIKKYEYL